MGMDSPKSDYGEKSCHDIFQAINSRQVKALMFHDQMADLFDFLGLMGYKRMHEYQFFSESAEHRTLKRYYLNHHNHLLMEESVTSPHVIPSEWGQYCRFDVTPQVRRQAVEKAFKEYNDWECETKKCYEDYAKQLFEMGNMADFNKVMDLVEDVDMEVKKLDRMYLTLKSVNFNEVYIATVQESLHDEYRLQTKEIGIDIC